MKRLILVSIFFCSISLFSTMGWGLGITPSNDAVILADGIIGSAGSGIAITSVMYDGHELASGTYWDGPLGIVDGSIVTNGLAEIALPPDDSGGAGFSQGRVGDPVLCEPLTSPHQSYDANKLTIIFDLEEGYDGISFLFVFGSEEYPEYVGTEFNDVFGAYLNGTQVAFDNDGNPITINGPFFSGGSVVLPDANGTEYDGSTPILQTKAPLNGGTTENELTFIVCDAGDHVLDSGVFIAALIGCIGENCTGTRPCESIDDDGDGFNACDDCDDFDDTIFPGAEEVCNSMDDDCDGYIDEGGVCCDDNDLDGVCDEDDNCPSIYNPTQIDQDGDSIGDVCDSCPLDSDNDMDGEGLCADVDNCIDVFNPDQLDNDLDGVGDECDDDDDNDGVRDTNDNCIYNYNPDQTDSDSDGVGDACDEGPDDDIDNDGVADSQDQCLTTEPGEIVNENGCSIDEICPCENDWKNHGGYVSCVAHAAEDLLDEGKITEAEKEAIVSEAGQSDCGHKK